MDLRMHVDEIHIEYYDVDETQLFFKALERRIIEDIKTNKNNWQNGSAPDLEKLICNIRTQFWISHNGGEGEPPCGKTTQ